MDATQITFEIAGDPIPQPRARFSQFSRHAYTPTKNGIGVLKQAIAIRAAMEAKRRGWAMTKGPHWIHVEAVFARPKSHYGRDGAPKASAPSFPGKNCGDNDNIEKGVWDAITESGAIWHDDTQIVSNGCDKRYAAPGEQARTVITIRRPPP
jgi:Holliday junction resolvase RusA-like endonuclease